MNYADEVRSWKPRHHVTINWRWVARSALEGMTSLLTLIINYLRCMDANNSDIEVKIEQSTTTYRPCTLCHDEGWIVQDYQVGEEMTQIKTRCTCNPKDSDEDPSAP